MRRTVGPSGHDENHRIFSTPKTDTLFSSAALEVFDYF